jgi:uncharacterized protein (DUF488 family)
MKIFTIGFTHTSAESFFTRVRTSGARRVIDVRLHNVSQLSGFAKRDDLRYFLGALSGVSYVHRLELAPTDEMLGAYKKKGGDWATYERAFRDLLRAREIERTLTHADVEDACLLCSEHQAHHCHRRIVAEYLRDAWGRVEIVHL